MVGKDNPTPEGKNPTPEGKEKKRPVIVTEK